MKCCFPEFTRQQWMIFINCVLGNFFCAMTYSLQSPFFPEEAQDRGLSVSVYGVVFSVYELTVLVTSPVFTMLLRYCSLKKILTCGLLVSGLSCMCFGALAKVWNGELFFGLAIFIRILEACGQAAYFVSSVTAIVISFNTNVSCVVSVLEMFFSFGTIFGPAVGGILYKVGGFAAPFAAVGGILIICTISAAVFWPSHSEQRERERDVLPMLKIPSIWLGVCAVFVGASCAGFLQVTLEPHLISFNLDSISVGFMFCISGCAYAVTAPLWSWLCSNYLRPKSGMIISSVLRIIGFSLIGPFPLLNLHKSIPLIAGGLAINGISAGGQFITGFLDPLFTAYANGYQESVETSSLITCIWRSAFSLGGLFGPFTGGFLFDHFGFPNATYLIHGINYALALLALYFFQTVADVRPKNERQVAPSTSSTLSSISSLEENDERKSLLPKKP